MSRYLTLSETASTTFSVLPHSFVASTHRFACTAAFVAFAAAWIYRLWLEWEVCSVICNVMQSSMNM